MVCRVRVVGLGKSYPAAMTAPLSAGLAWGARLLGVELLAPPIAGSPPALDDVSFSIGEGERVGVIGDNGAGKSTLLRLLAGVATPSHGIVEIEGRVHAALTLGLSLRDDLTGRENLIIDAEIQGQGRAEIAPRLEAMIEFAELGEFIDRPVRTYSSGMKARLAFTSLVFVEPEILLLDETLSVGDHWFAQKAFAAIRRLCAQGRIVVIVSHGLDSIVELCTRCLWLDGGRILADGDPAAVTSAYRKTIRAREEAEFVRHFDVGPADGHGPVRQVSVVAGDGREPRAVLELGEPAHVRARIDRSATETDGEVHLRIERQDGIVVQWAHTRLRDLAPSASGGWLDIEASLGPALLRPSYYRVAVGLSGPSRRTTWASTTFKVISAHTPVGGDPALRWPIRMAARRIA